MSARQLAILILVRPLVVALLEYDDNSGIIRKHPTAALNDHSWELIREVYISTPKYCCLKQSMRPVVNSVSLDSK